MQGKVRVRIRRRGLRFITAACLVMSLLAPNAVAEVGAQKCFGKKATVVAKAGQETKGTRKTDVIIGTRGSDSIDGRGGNDLICGRGGDDVLYGGKGSDRLNGGRDSGYGDTFYPGPGDDIIDGGPEGSGMGLSDFGDWVLYEDATGPVHADLETGEATAVGLGSDSLADIEQVSGGPYDDLLTGNEATNWLLGGNGDDVLDANGGNLDSMNPGLGDDTVIGTPGSRNWVGYEDTPSEGAIIDLTSQTVTGVGNDSLSNITDAGGTLGADTLIGTDGPNYLFGQSGDDTLNGNGNDADLSDPASFIGGFNLDVLVGDCGCFGTGENELGDDSFIGGSGVTMVSFVNSTAPAIIDLSEGTASGEGSDTLTGVNAVVGSDHDDQIIGTDGSDLFEGSPGNDSINGGEGTDVVIAFHALGGTEIDLDAGTMTGKFPGFVGGMFGFYDSDTTLTNIDDAWGSLDFPDEIIGDENNNKLVGMSGDDSLSGAGGDDHLDGMEGTDTANGGSGTDTCVGIEEAEACEEESPSVSRQVGKARWIRTARTGPLVRMY